jgi:dTDP-glucose pyrophosphorylase
MSEKQWSKAILDINSSIEQAAQVLNESSLKIVLVLDATGTLIGTISDGDIRRGLLKGLGLNSSIDSIVHEDALVVPPDLSRELVVQLMKANMIQQIPIVDQNKHVIGLHIWDQISAPSTRENIMVIMAGGKGTRLLPQTANCPKPLLPIAGKPILEHIINRAKSEGFSNFIIAIHHLGYMIEEYFGSGEALGVKIEYLREEEPLGTAGALKLLSPRPDLPFVVTNGDVVTDIRYSELLEFHIENFAKATMAVKIYKWQNPFGVVSTNGIEIVSYEEKPIFQNLINAGVYIVDPSVIQHLPTSMPYTMPSLLETLRHMGERVIAFPIHEAWLDVGRPSELLEAREKLFKVQDNKS